MNSESKTITKILDNKLDFYHQKNIHIPAKDIYIEIKYNAREIEEILVLLSLTIEVASRMKKNLKLFLMKNFLWKWKDILS